MSTPIETMDDDGAFALVKRLADTAELVDSRPGRGRLLDSTFPTPQHDSFPEPMTAPRKRGKTKPFRFLDLPAELRNRVYHLAVQKPFSMRLRHCKPAAITRVSRQLRNEALCVFFDVNTFVAEVKSNYCSAWRRYYPETHNQFKQVGTLRLRKELMSMLKLSGKQVARIHNIDFCVLDAKNYNGTPQHLYAVVSVRSPSGFPGRTKITTHSQGTSSIPWGGAEIAKDLQYVTEIIQASLEEMVAKPDFNGFSIDMLKRVANSFRVTPRDGRTLLR